MDSKLKPAGSMTVTIDGKTSELPIFEGAHGPRVVDFRKFYTDTGLFTFDPGFTSTASCESQITFIDGDAGIMIVDGNLTIEPGSSTLDEMIASIELGVMMRTNVSWSIDDSRNKFQFGCEWGQRIRNGKLAEVVRNPNYRGISATFWRSLAKVGNASTLEILGTPFCGKGEPNQVIRVGHASPACKFTAVDVFGAEE